MVLRLLTSWLTTCFFRRSWYEFRESPMRTILFLRGFWRRLGSRRKACFGRAFSCVDGAETAVVQHFEGRVEETEDPDENRSKKMIVLFSLGIFFQRKPEITVEFLTVVCVESLAVAYLASFIVSLKYRRFFRMLTASRICAQCLHWKNVLLCFLMSQKPSADLHCGQVFGDLRRSPIGCMVILSLSVLWCSA